MSKDWSSCFKGVALILMLIFHLWNPFVDMGYETKGVFHQEMAAFGSICVSIFVFLSGYGLVVSNSCTTLGNTFKRVKKLYLNFWKVWIIATPIILILGVATFDVKRIILEFAGANPSYNKMFWFIYLYVELVCFYFLYRKVEFKNKDLCFIAVTLFIGSISSILNLFTIPQISRFLESLPCFLMGIAFAKSDMFSKLSCKRMGGAILLILIVLFRIWIFYNTPLYVKKYIDFIIVPVFLWTVMNIGVSTDKLKPLLVVGKYSTYMWFIHGYFYFYYPEIIYWPKYSILIFAWLFSLSLVLSVIVEKTWNLINYILKDDKKTFGRMP